MKYVHLSLEGRDLNWFSPLIQKGGYKGFTISFSSPKDVNYFIEDKKYLSFPINYDFILEYFRVNYPPLGLPLDVIGLVNGFYEKIFPLIKAGDTVISGNSGEWTSRTLHEICRKVGAKFYYFEGMYFKNSFQLSTRPFSFCKQHGTPEINDFVTNQNEVGKGEEYYEQFLRNKNTKWAQPMVKSPGCDVFIPGQVPTDTNVILLERQYKSSEHLCYHEALKNPNLRFIYKPHPKALLSGHADYVEKGLENIKTLPNVKIMTDLNVVSAMENCNEVWTISSTVGIEASLRGKPVKWFSNTNYKDFPLSTLEEKYKFMEACNNYMTYLPELRVLNENRSW